MIDHNIILLDLNFVGGAGKETLFNNGDPRTEVTMVDGKYRILFYDLKNASDLSSLTYYDSNSYVIQNPTESGDPALNAQQVYILQTVLSPALSDHYAVSFSDVANIDFDYGTISSAHIVVGQYKDGNQGVAGNTYTSNPSINSGVVVPLQHGDVWLSENFRVGWNPTQEGTPQYMSVIHELGHALGLDHPDSISVYNNQKYTLMSYEQVEGMKLLDENNQRTNDTVTPFGLQLLDIAAIQEIYGTNWDTRNEDNTQYSKATAFASSRPNDAFVYTIWDGGGTGDTIDASGFMDGVKINLNAGAFSSIGKSADATYDGSSTGGRGLGLADDNVAIAYKAQIENAKGTKDKDDIIGNGLNNTLEGLGGADTIISGLGNNTVYGGDQNDTITITDGASGTYDGGSGDDTFIVEHSGQPDFTATLTLSGGTGFDTLTLKNGTYVADNRDPKNVTVSTADGSFRTTLDSIEEVHIDTGRVLNNVNADYDLTIGPQYDYSFLSSAQGGLDVDIDIFTSVSFDNDVVSHQRKTDASIAVNGHTHAGTMFNGTITNANGQTDLNLTSAGSYRGSNNGDTININALGISVSLGRFFYTLGTGDDVVTITHELSGNSIGDFSFTYTGGTDVINNLQAGSNIVVAGDIHIGDTNVTVTTDNDLIDTVVLTTPEGTWTLNGIGGAAFDINFVSGGRYEFNANGTYNIDGTTQDGYVLETSWGDDVVVDNDNVSRHYVSLDGTDSILAGSGDDTLNGGYGSDRLDGGAGDDTLSTGGGDDVVFVGEDNDIVSTGTGSDVIVVKAGALGIVTITDFDIFNDVLDLSNVSDAQDINTLQYYQSGGNTVISVEGGGYGIVLQNTSAHTLMENNFVFGGSPYVYQLPLVPVTTVTGTSSSDTLYTFDGFGAVIDGLGGDDDIEGYYGNDYLNGGSGSDTLVGDDGNDVLNGGSVQDYLYGGYGDDFYIFDVTNDFDISMDVIEEDAGIDTIVLQGNATTSNTVLTQSGEHLQITNNDPNNFWGGVFIRWHFVDYGGGIENPQVEYIVIQDVVYDLQEVYDTGVWTPYGAGTSTGLHVEDDLITIDGGGLVTGNVFANNGNGVDYDSDSLYLEVIPLSQSGAFGTFDIDANGSFTINAPVNYVGNHSFSYTVKDSDGNEEQANVVLDFTVSNYTPVAGAIGVERTVPSGSMLSFIPSFTDADNDTLTYSMAMQDGSAVPYFSIDSVTGEISGLADTDYGTYAIRITASDGIEEVTHDMDINVYLLTQGTTALDYLHGGAGIDLMLGNDGDDRLYGYEGDDILQGQAGEDRVFGNEGNDYITGGDDIDVLYGHQDNDEIYGDAGDDYIYGDDEDGLDSYIGGGDDVLYGGDGEDRIKGGVGNDELHGDAGIDVLFGNSGEDILYGGTELDYLYGGDGNDMLHGGSGDDQLRGDGGDDTLYGDDGADDLYGHTGNDTLYGGADNDRLYGDDGNDTFYGDDGSDTIYGGNGDDIIIGGNGRDYLNGEAGADTFYLDLDEVDRVRDFEQSEGDKINIADLLDGFDSATDDVNDFVDIVIRSNTRTDIRVDEDGQGGFQYVGIVYSDLTGETVDSLVASGALIVE